MLGVVEIDGFVILDLALERICRRVGAEKRDVTRLRFQSGAIEQRPETGASPFGDAAPTFHTILSRDLSSGGSGAQFRKRKAQGIFNKAADFKPIIGELIFGHPAIALAVGLSGAIGARVRRNSAGRIFARKPLTEKRAAQRSIHRLRALENSAYRGRTRQSIAGREAGAGGGHKRSAHECSTINRSHVPVSH